MIYYKNYFSDGFIYHYKYKCHYGALLDTGDSPRFSKIIGAVSVIT